MHRSNQQTLGVILFTLMLAVTQHAGATDWFVDQTDGNDSNTGLDNFSNAKETLQAVLGNINLSAGDRVFVAAGTYNVRGSAGSAPRTATFTIPAGVQVYGGFLGISSEDDPSQADPATNITILTGDIGEDDVANTPASWDDNAYHVITVIGNEDDDIENTIINGFTITAGVADGTDDDSVGGAFYIQSLEGSGSFGPTISRCRIINNRSLNAGGAIIAIDIGAQLRDCEFRQNFTGGSGYDSGQYLGGGAIATGSTGVLHAINCTFVDNHSEEEHGGAISDFLTTSKIVNCQFFGNSAPTGGGMFTRNIVVNCLFAGNFASDGDGGGMYGNGRAEVHGCTFSDNEATNLGGGVAAVARLTNSIVWRNVYGGDPSPEWKGQADIGCGSGGGLEQLEHHSGLDVSELLSESGRINLLVR